MTSRSNRPPPAARAGFTLIELMLVVVIVGIASAVVLPRFVHSFKGARLRTAARIVSMSSRYARSTAVLHQQDMALIFYPGRNEVELVSFGQFAGAPERDRFLDSRDQRAVAGLLEDEESMSPAEEGPPAQIESEMVRELPEGIEIVEVQVNGDILDIENAYVANFYANGMCDPFTMFLRDEDEREASVEVDPLSGKVTLAYPEGGR